MAEKCEHVNNSLGLGEGGGGFPLALWSRHWLSFIAKGGLEDFAKDHTYNFVKRSRDQSVTRTCIQ